MITLALTCSAYPEQYDALLDGRQVGYLRLRHGIFSVRYPDVDGETIFEARPRGDGAFLDDERESFLNTAISNIEERLAYDGIKF